MWDVDYLQFARLLDEINAVGLTQEQMKAVATRMNVEPKEVRELMNRASARWDDLGKLLTKKTPLTEEQVSEELAENGRVEAIVTMDLSEIVGNLEDDAVDNLLDDLAERVSPHVELDDIDYRVLFTDGDTLYVKVTSKAEDDLTEDEEDEDEMVE